MSNQPSKIKKSPRYFALLLPLLLITDALVNNAHAAVETVVDCIDLQAKLDQLPQGQTLQLAQAYELTCNTFERTFDGLIQRQPLIVPEGVTLDLNDSHLKLELSGGSYGVRLSRRSHIANGKITVVGSISPGSQKIWHSAISVGAAFDDGGTAAQPNYHSEIYDWSIQNMQLHQNARDRGSVIGIMSSSHHGLISDVVIADSSLAGHAISMDAGTVGPLHFASPNMCTNRQLFLAGEAYTTHPHDIRIENVVIGALTHAAEVDETVTAGIWISGGHDITVDGVIIQETTFAGLAVDAGDVGFEFARDPDRARAYKGLEFANITQHVSRTHGVYINGVADNVYRAKVTHGQPCEGGALYDSLLDPQYTAELRVIDSYFRGDRTLSQTGTPKSGVRTQCVRGVLLESLDVAEFELGVHLADGTHNSTLWRSEIQQNLKHGVDVSGDPSGVMWCPSRPAGNKAVNNAVSVNYIHNNGVHCNGCPGADWAGINVGNSSVTDIVLNDIGNTAGGEPQKCGIRKTVTADTVRLNGNVIHSYPVYGSPYCGF